MADDNIIRKLTVILSADAQGYSRLMSADEVNTVRTLTACRDIIGSAVEAHGGRVVDSPGDNLLAEFSSVVSAVKCALAIQTSLKEVNAELPEERRMAFRIGVNLGEVIVDGERLYGDGVNVAARLEGLTEGGGICISGKVYDQIQSRMTLGCEYMGEQHVKNIPSPVRVFKIWDDPDAAGCSLAAKEKQPAKIRRAVAAAAMVVLLAIGGVYYWSTFRSPDVLGPDEVGKAAAPLPDKPSIAVLPFENLSDNRSRQYLCDGITRDLITDLSKFSELAVAAGYLTSKYKAREKKLEQIGRELRVRYILEGSMQTSADRIRINTQLIDVPNGSTLWAERYDRKVKDIFDVQDEIIRKTVRALSLKISEAEQNRVQQKDTASYQAYDYVQQGWYLINQKNRAGNHEAVRLFKEAAAVDPDYAEAYLGLAAARMEAVNYGWTEFPGKAFGQALEFAEKAVSLDPGNTHARANLGYIYMRKGEFDLAVKELETAIDLNPNDWRSYRHLGAVLLYSGRPADALQWYEKSMKYDPYVTSGMLMNIGIIHLLENRHETAVRWLTEATGRWPDFLGARIILTATYAEMGQLNKAQKQASQVKRISPFFKTEFYGSAYRNREHRARIVNGLKKAGLE